jgi:hypothetical protein
MTKPELLARPAPRARCMITTLIAWPCDRCGLPARPAHIRAGPKVYCETCCGCRVLNSALFLPSSRPLKPSTPRPASTVSNRRTTP